MKASKATAQARVDDVLRIILDGAEPWDIRQYVSEKEAGGEPPWAVPEGGKPLGERQLRRYCRRAEQMMADAGRTNRKRLLRKHAAQRRNLYARALNKGDERTALAVLRDLAELQGLYGSEVARQVEELRKELDALQRASHDDDGDPPAADGHPPGHRETEGGAGGEPGPPPAQGGPEPPDDGRRDNPGLLATDVAPLHL
jgi:hypothetical protein